MAGWTLVSFKEVDTGWKNTVYMNYDYGCPMCKHVFVENSNLCPEHGRIPEKMMIMTNIENKIKETPNEVKTE